ncbi:hypothetical protein Bca101_061557 [Brassica carinata]
MTNEGATTVTPSRSVDFRSRDDIYSRDYGSGVVMVAMVMFHPCIDLAWERTDFDTAVGETDFDSDTLILHGREPTSTPTPRSCMRERMERPTGNRPTGDDRESSVERARHNRRRGEPQGNEREDGDNR